MTARMNRIPYFLWLTDKREDFKVDLKNQKLTSDELGSSSISAVPVFYIFILKYLPILGFSYFFMLPKTLMDFYMVCVATLLIGVGYFLVKNELVLRLFLILFCFVNIYLVFTIDNYAINFASMLTFFAELLLVGAVAYDVFILKGYKNWYFLKSFRRDLNLTIAKKTEKKFFFKKVNTGFDFKRKFEVIGFFIRVVE